MITNRPSMPRLEISRLDCGVSVSLFSTSFIILSITVLALSFFINSFLPQPDHQYLHSNSDKFNASRAYRDLEELTSIGPRPTGSYANEVLAVNLLTRKILQVQQASINRPNKVEYDVQKTKGCFSFLPGSPILCYDNVQNVIVKLQSSGKRVNESILINCHYDSVPTSPGASDDGLNCAVMLEILRILSDDKVPLTKNVIFLFNGAEETGLRGSHGFVTQHKWAKNIVSFINLESCGAGGREILFQSGPNAAIISKIYAGVVPYPYGTVIGEELFQSGLLPSDTDFRIFRDYGNLKGLDFAHFKNGYVYHTNADNISYVSTSVIQHTGSNMIALIRGFINSKTLKSDIEDDQQQTVFYDVLGKFMIIYSMSTAFILNMLAVFISFWCTIVVTLKIFKNLPWKMIMYQILTNMLFIVLSLFMGTSTLYILSLFVKMYHSSMLWYAHPWFAILYYGLPFIYVTSSVLRLRRKLIKSKLNVENEVVLYLIIIQNTLTLLIFVATLLYIRSAYVLMISVISSSIAHLLNFTIFRNSTAKRKMLVYLATNFVSLLNGSNLTVQVIQVLFPMMGRLGANIDNEMIMWILIEFIMLLLFIIFIPLTLLVKNFWKIQLTLGISFIIFVLTVIFIFPLKPFTDSARERFEIMYVNRRIHNDGENNDVQSVEESSGYFLTAIDKRAPQTINELFGEEYFTRTDVFCDKYLLCASPLSKLNGYSRNYAYSYWRPGPKMKPPIEKEMKIRMSEDNESRSFSFSVKGAECSIIAIRPLSSFQLVKWSFGNYVPENNNYFSRDDDIYIFNYIRGEKADSNAWQFSLTFELADDIESTDSLDLTKTFELSWTSHFSYNTTKDFPHTFNEMLNNFPSWTHVSPSLTEVELYVI